MEVVRTSPQSVSEPARTIKQFVAAATLLDGCRFRDDFTARVWSRDGDPGSEARHGESGSDQRRCFPVSCQLFALPRTDRAGRRKGAGSDLGAVGTRVERSGDFWTITQGVPGTEMPANNFEDSETRAIIAYLRSLSPASKPGVAETGPEASRFFSAKALAPSAIW